MIFVKVKVLFKKKFKNIYNIVHKIVFPVYVKYYRNFKLKKFNGEYLHNFSFDNVDFKIWLNRKNAFIDEEIFVNGVYEPEVLKLHKRELKEGDVYIDVGANIGDTGLFAASLVGKSGQVICFEPIKDLASQIEKSKNENDFTQLIVVNKGLSNENKKAFIYKNDKNIGASSLIDLGTSVDKEEIVLTCGEEELGRLKRIDFIKVDVEGHEVSVFDVLRERISTFKPKIIFEFTPKMYGENKLSILYMLQGFGYKIFDLEENELEIKDIGYWYKCFESKGRLQTNLFCVFKNIS